MRTEKLIKPNAEQVWKQVEDQLVPRLRLTVIERVVYCYLVRHSRLEGKHRLLFSITWLANGVRLTDAPVRAAVRHLAALGALRLLERGRAGHLVQVRLPDEIRTASSDRAEPHPVGPSSPHFNIEETDFFQTTRLRQSLHARERGTCFYCLRRIPNRSKCLDHVVPEFRFGRNSYRNLVSSCLECNCLKGKRKAKEFLRSLYREGRLTSRELKARFRALTSLAAGKLRPLFRSGDSHFTPRRARPPHRSTNPQAASIQTPYPR
jgi:5-methylcytosine-specific restriction endonuclease McrA